MIVLVLTMIASLQAVGVILLLGLLIAPAATVYLLCDSYPAMLWGGGFIGMFGSCAGLLLSYRLNLPSGACIVLVLGRSSSPPTSSARATACSGALRRARHFHEESLARWAGRTRR